MNIKYGNWDPEKGLYTVTAEDIKKHFSESVDSPRAKLILDSMTNRENFQLLGHAIEEMEEAIYKHAMITLKEVDARLPLE